MPYEPLFPPEQPPLSHTNPWRTPHHRLTPSETQTELAAQTLPVNDYTQEELAMNLDSIVEEVFANINAAHNKGNSGQSEWEEGQNEERGGVLL